MKNPISTRVLALAAISCSALVAAPAAFAQGTFTPGTGSTANCNPNNPPTTFDSVSCSVGSVSVNMTAWGYMSGLNTTTATAGWVQGRVGDFNASGFGAYTGSNESTSGSQHAFDSVTSGCGTGSGASAITLSTANSGCGGAVEAVLLNFGSASVNLSQVGIGYRSGDADMSVYAWTGGASGPTMATQTLKSSTTGAGTMAGWTLVGSNDTDAVNPWNTGSSLYSSYFLITTYFGATSGSLNGGDDKFKLNTFTVACNGNCTTTTTTGTVPEPASLALASLGLAAVLGVRRRRTPRDAVTA